MKYLTLMIRRNISSTNRIDIDPPLGLDRGSLVVRRLFRACFRSYSLHVMGKCKLFRDLLQGMDLREKIQREGDASHCVLQVTKASCMSWTRSGVQYCCAMPRLKARLVNAALRYV